MEIIKTWLTHLMKQNLVTLFPLIACKQNMQMACGAISFFFLHLCFDLETQFQTHPIDSIVGYVWPICCNTVWIYRKTQIKIPSQSLGNIQVYVESQNDFPDLDENTGIFMPTLRSIHYTNPVLLSLLSLEFVSLI